MKAFFREIFRYHHHLNQLMIDEIEKHEKKLPERSLPLFCHLLNAHQVWNARILNTVPLGINDVHPLQKLSLINQSNLTDTMNILENCRLEDEITYRTSQNQEFTNNIRDILFHVNNHSTHHRAQIVSDFRQAGVTPLITDYIFYKR